MLSAGIWEIPLEYRPLPERTNLLHMKSGSHSIVFLLLALAIAWGACRSEQGKSDLAGSTGDAEIDALTALINQNPGNDSLYVLRAGLYDARKNYDAAIQDMATAMRIDSNDLEYHYLLSDLYMRYAKSRLALQTMERAASLVPDDVPSLLRLARIQTQLKMMDASLQTIGKVLALEPQNPEAFFLTGVNLREKGDTDRAINAFQKCFELEPEHLDACLNLGLLWEIKDNPIALKYYDNALRIDSTNTLAYYNKGMYFMNRRQDDQAIALFEKLLTIDSHYRDAYFNIGIIYLERDSFAKAYDLFNITVTEDPLYDMGFYYRGIANEKLNRLEAAQEDYKQAAGLSPSYAKFQEALEKIKRKLNQ